MAPLSSPVGASPPPLSLPFWWGNLSPCGSQARLGRGVGGVKTQFEALGIGR